MLFEIDRIGFFDGLLGFGGRVFVMKLGSVVTCQWVVEMPVAMLLAAISRSNCAGVDKVECLFTVPSVGF